MSPSLKPDSELKDSYYRRLRDVARGLDKLEIGRASPTIRFFGYYFGCEKIARGIVEIYKQWDADKAYSHKTQLKLNQIRKAADAIGLNFPLEDIEWIFADHDEQKKLVPTSDCKYSARHLRNRATHEIGPSNVE